jgi:hypothetical protein
MPIAIKPLAAQDINLHPPPAPSDPPTATDVFNAVQYFKAVEVARSKRDLQSILCHLLIKNSCYPAQSYR